MKLCWLLDHLCLFLWLMLIALGLPHQNSLAFSFLVSQTTSTARLLHKRSNTHCGRTRFPLYGLENNGAEEEDDYDDDDEDDDNIQPYGNRSLAWTKRYRRLLPYEECRKRVLTFGHRSKADWDECVENGWQGAYVPARPDEMYAKEWESWEEFLGLMRPYNETQNIAVNVLGLRSMNEYMIFVQAQRKRAELLRIPLRPDKVYKDEWVDEDHFFRKNK